MQTKFSKQRTLLLQELQSRYDHPTADQLYLALRAKMPQISLGTVYRNLAMLDQSGQIRRIVTGSSDRFDGNVSPHYHFICTVCGCTIDLDFPRDVTLCQRAGASFDGRIDAHELCFYGLCSECLDKQS